MARSSSIPRNSLLATLCSCRHQKRIFKMSHNGQNIGGHGGHGRQGRGHGEFWGGFSRLPQRQVAVMQQQQQMMAGIVMMTIPLGSKSANLPAADDDDAATCRLACPPRYPDLKHCWTPMILPWCEAAGVRDLDTTPARRSGLDGTDSGDNTLFGMRCSTSLEITLSPRADRNK